MEHATDPNFIGTLGLNWKLFLAQLVNFAIVLFILWKWVFKPVAGALEQRRLRVEASVKQAEEIERRMNEFKAWQEQEMQKARREAEGVLEKAAVMAESAKQETIESARAEVDKIMAKTKQTIEAEKQQMLGEVRAELAEIVSLATEKILMAKLDERKDKELINNVLKAVK